MRSHDRTGFQLHFDQILWIIDQSGERLEGSVERLHIFKRLSAERVPEACAVVNLYYLSSLIQPSTIALVFVFRQLRNISHKSAKNGSIGCQKLDRPSATAVEKVIYRISAN